MYRKHKIRGYSRIEEEFGRTTPVASAKAALFGRVKGETKVPSGNNKSENGLLSARFCFATAKIPPFDWSGFCFDTKAN